MRLRAIAEAIAPVPSLVLVHNQKRLPLHRADGTPLPLALKDDPGATVNGRIRLERLHTDLTDKTWEAEVPAVGYVRLFVDVPVAELRSIALLDPPVKSLAMG